jgi:hypothetical protein
VRTAIQTKMTRWPNKKDFIMLMFDLDVQMGNYEEAYQLIAPEVQRRPDTETLFRACLISGVIGEVYPGQLEYLLTHGPFGLNATGLWPQKATAGTVAALSAFTLWSVSHMGNNVDFYWDLARKLDPNEAMFAMAFAARYKYRGHAAQAFKVLDTAVAHTIGNYNVLRLQ